MATLVASFRERVGPVRMRETLRNYFFLTLGAIVMIVNFNLFIAPANVAPGGVSGLALILNDYTGIPKGTSMLLLSIPLLAWASGNSAAFDFSSGRSIRRCSTPSALT